MPSYHSVFNKIETQKFCGIPALDFKKDKTPSLDPTKLSTAIKDNQLDIIDEALIYFRINVLFKNFNIEGDADKLLVYITVFIQKCLEKGNDQDVKKAKDNINKLINACEWIPKSDNFFNMLKLQWIENIGLDWERKNSWDLICYLLNKKLIN